MKKILFILLLATVLFSCNKQEYEFCIVQDLETKKQYTFEYYSEDVTVGDTMVLQYNIDSRNTSDKEISLYGKYNPVTTPSNYIIEYKDYVVYIVFNKAIVIKQY